MSNEAKRLSEILIDESEKALKRHKDALRNAPDNIDRGVSMSNEERKAYLARKKAKLEALENE